MKFNKRGQLVLTEKDTRKQCCSYLKALGVYWWWNLQGLGAYKGIPDIEGRYKGYSFWVEFKAPKGRVSEHQEKFIQRVKEHGDQVFVAFSFEVFRMEWESWVKQIKAGRL